MLPEIAGQAVDRPLGVADRPARRARLWLQPRWGGAGGLRELALIAAPLILTQAVHALNLFLDRLFLANYGANDFAACVQGGVAWWALVTIPFGVVAYANTFVAQYTGANEHRRVGPALWQAIYLALAGAAYALVFYPVVPWFFGRIGHEAPLPALETSYFRILLAQVPFVLGIAALSSFYSGRGKSWPIVAVNCLTLGVNAWLNWWFIFHGGPGGVMPRGIEGCGWATVISSIAGFAAFAALVLHERHDREFNTRGGWRLDRDLMSRMIRYGVPAGIHNFVDMIAFTAFLLVVGRFGIVSQVASNMGINLNMVVFIPMVGIYTACQVVSGKYVAAGRPSGAERATVGALIAAVGYFTVVGAIFAVFPRELLAIFTAAQSTPGEVFAQAEKLAQLILLIVALYSLFDAVCLALAGTLRGAGDTKFVMWASIILSSVFLTIPCIVIGMNAHRFEPAMGMYLCWGFLSLYIFSAAVFYALRYRQGSWMRMRVIEETPSMDDIGVRERSPELQSA